MNVTTNSVGNVLTLTVDNLPQGVANTYGNFLRRSLLINDMGWDLAAMRINRGEVRTVFETIDGVAEDCLELYSNMSQIRVDGQGALADVKQVLFESSSNLEVLTAGDLQPYLNGLTILNPELVLCHFIGNSRMIFELVFRYEKGCISEQQNKLFLHSIMSDDLAASNITFASTHRSGVNKCFYEVSKNEDLTEKLVLTIEGASPEYKTVISRVLKETFNDLKNILVAILK